MSHTVTQTSLLEFMTAYVQAASETYLTDITHADAEALAEVPVSPGIPPMDFLIECAEENLEVAHILRHEAFSVPCLDNYHEHPGVDELGPLTAALEASAKDLLAAVEAIGDKGLADDIVLPDGKSMPAFRLATRAANHMKYHDLYTGLKR